MRIMVALILMLRMTTATFGNTQQSFHGNEKFEEIYKETLRATNEYSQIMSREYQIWTICRREGDPKYIADCTNEWEAKEYFQKYFENGQKYDFFLSGRICEDGSPEELKKKFEAEPIFLVLYNLVPPNEKRIQKMGELYSYLEAKKIPVFWKVEPLTGEEYTHGEYIVEVGFGNPQWAPLAPKK